MNERQLPQTLESRLTRLEDIEAIKKLKSMFAAYSDAGYDGGAIAELFTEDGVFELPGAGSFRGRDAITRGRSAIRELMSGWANTIKWAHHMTMNPLIEIDAGGKTASASWLTLTFMSVEDRDGGLEAVFGSGTYEVKLVKENEEWKFSHVLSKTHHLSDFAKGWVKQQNRQI